MWGGGTDIFMQAYRTGSPMVGNDRLTGPRGAMTSLRVVKKVASNSLTMWMSGSLKIVPIFKAMVSDNENILQTSIGWAVWSPGAV